MPQAMPKTNQEAMMGILQQIAAAMAAPDADLSQLADLQKMVVAQIRQPYDTPSPGTPVGSAMNLGTGAAPPSGPAPGELSPMLAALMANANGGGPGSPMAAATGPASLPPGTYQPGGLATRTPPNPDELRRILTPS